MIEQHRGRVRRVSRWWVWDCYDCYCWSRSLYWEPVLHHGNVHASYYRPGTPHIEEGTKR